MTTTTTYSFNTPTPGTEEDSWGALLNSNWDDVDDLLDGTTPVVRVRLTTASLGTDINPANGQVQSKTLAANTTFTESLSAGDQVLLHISGGDTYTVTWPTMTWVGGSEPTLTGGDAIGLYKIGSTLYGVYIGGF